MYCVICNKEHPEMGEICNTCYDEIEQDYNKYQLAKDKLDHFENLGEQY